MESNDIMKLEEVMQYLDIGKNTLYGLLKSGELNAFKLVNSQSPSSICRRIYQLIAPE